jgi:guanylate kinase
LEVARAELAAKDEFDATVLNDDVQRAAGELVALMVGTGPPDRHDVVRCSSPRASGASE